MDNISDTCLLNGVYPGHNETLRAVTNCMRQNSNLIF